MSTSELNAPSNEQLLGRADLNDLEAIMAVSASDQPESIRAVKDNADAIFTWDYEKGARPALNKLYEKAKGSMWNGETDLPWELDVDQEKLAAESPLTPTVEGFAELGIDFTGTPFGSWTNK